MNLHLKGEKCNLCKASEIRILISNKTFTEREKERDKERERERKRERERF